MHELSLAMSIVDVAVEELARRPGDRIVAIHLKVGRLAGVVPEALRSAFELARESTPVSTAELVVEDVPVVAYCRQCAAERAVEFPNLCCPNCGSPTPDVVGGRELEVVALEIESPCTEPLA